MTWMKKSMTTMEPREMRLEKIQLVIDVADADQARQLDISGETKTARILRTPETPTDAVRMAHTPILCCESRTKFSAQTSCGEQDSGYTAEIPDRLHVHSNSGREQNSAMYHIRGNAQWSSAKRWL